MISSYYQYSFISPDAAYAQVREEMRSYFESGVVDDTLFAKWTNYCLRMLGKSSLKIEHDLLLIEDYQARLPNNFHSVKEAWGTFCISNTVPLPGALYENITRNISTDYNRCGVTSTCLPDIVRVTYKTTSSYQYEYKVQSLLRPGNLNAIKSCGTDCLNIGSTGDDSFDIRGNKLITSFATGSVYLVYYAENFDENGYQLIPDSQRIENYIQAHLKYKLYEMISNSVTDETFNQIELKKRDAENKRDEAFIAASNEQKKETTRRKIERMKRVADTFKYYHIP